MSNEFKKVFDSIAPDVYMGNRILANIKEHKKRKFPLKPVLSGALAFAVALGCFGAAQYKTSYVDRPFSVMAVDASDDVPVTAEISENAMNIPNHFQLIHNDDSTIETNGDMGFYVVGDDIDYVQYQSKTGSFYYYDAKKAAFDQQNRNYFTAVIPVADDEAEEIKSYIGSMMFNPEIEGIKHYAKTHDLSSYFSEENVDFNQYWVYFDLCANTIGYENEPGYAFFLIEAEKAAEYYYVTSCNEDSTDLTVYNYELSESTIKLFDDYYSDEMNNIGYSPDEAVNALSENPDINMSELPGDEITITVVFKDGKRARKTIAVSFDNEGYAQFKFK